MEQFLLGLLVGVALGMWGAILLYRIMGKQQPGWPLSRKKGGDKASSKDAGTDDLEDDFDDDYFATHYPDTAVSAPAPNSGATGDAQAGQSAKGTVVYTDPRRAAAPQPADLNDDAHTSDGQESDEEWAADWNDEESLWENDLVAESVSSAGGEPAAEAYRRLLALVEGDVQAAEELIDAEQVRTPAVPRSRLIQNAADRLEYGGQG